MNNNDASGYPRLWDWTSPSRWRCGQKPHHAKEIQSRLTAQGTTLKIQPEHQSGQIIYNNSLTWNKAILIHFGMIPLINHDSSEVAVRSL